MARGENTKALRRGALSSLGPALIDPTGASAVAFLATGTGYAIGSTYHITRGSLKRIKEAMASNRERKAAANTFNIPPAVHINIQEMFEHDFRRLAASLAGFGIRGVLFCVIPHAGVGLVINTIEAEKSTRKLSQLSRSVGGKRQLMSIISFRNAGVQALSGLLMKATVSTLFLGSDYDTFMDTANKAVEVFTPSSMENIEAAQEFHKEMVQLHPFAETPALASSLPGEYNDNIGLENRLESFNMDEEVEICWGDSVPCGKILGDCAKTAASDILVKFVVEVPLDNGVKKLTSHPNNGLASN